MEYKTVRIKEAPTSEIFNQIIRNLRLSGLKMQITPIQKQGNRYTYHKYFSRQLSSLWTLYETEEHEYFSHEKGKQGYRQQEFFLYKTSSFFSIPIKRTKKKILSARDYVSWKTSSDDKIDYESKVAETITFLKNKETKQLLRLIPKKNLEKVANTHNIENI